MVNQQRLSERALFAAGDFKQQFSPLRPESQYRGGSCFRQELRFRYQHRLSRCRASLGVDPAGGTVALMSRMESMARSGTIGLVWTKKLFRVTRSKLP